MPRRRLTALGIAASVAAVAAGGVAAGLGLEQRLIGRGVRRSGGRIDQEGPVDHDEEEFFSLRSAGPTITTPDGVRLHTEVDEPSGRHKLTIVFVHGYALSLDCWHFQRRHFRARQAELGARLVLYDQRSHGRSSHSAPARCRVPQLGNDLAQVLDEVSGDREATGPEGDWRVPIVLIGHSMGAMTIMDLARTRPDWFDGTGRHDIRGAALIATAADGLAQHTLVPAIPGPVFARMAPPLLATATRLPRLVEGGRRAGSDLGWILTRGGAFGRPDVPTAYVDFMTRMLAGTPMSVVADYYPAFAELSERSGLDVLATVATAVIGGEKDVITPVEHTRRVLERLPDAEAVILPDCGHMGIIECHDAIDPVLDRLIDRALAPRHPG